jgi:protein-S-isoprenylcysteine O-methyltransferase Ste14
MSSRTQDLPPMTGLSGLIREWRYNEFFRQTLGLLLMPVLSWFAQPQPLSFAVGAILALSGMLFRFYASGYIVKNKQLATSGPYSLVRHPLYTGNLLIVIGFTFASAQWWAVVVSLAFWFFYYPTAISYEDNKLHRIFGDDWKSWSQSVPAVIPRSIRIRSGGSWSLRTSWTENYELIIVVYTLLCLAYVVSKFD